MYIFTEIFSPLIDMTLDKQNNFTLLLMYSRMIIFVFRFV